MSDLDWRVGRRAGTVRNPSPERGLRRVIEDARDGKPLSTDDRSMLQDLLDQCANAELKKAYLQPGDGIIEECEMAMYG